jgi:hypothetical protein
MEVYTVYVSVLCAMLKPHLYKPYISLQELIEYSSLEIQQLLRLCFWAPCKPVIFCSYGTLCDMIEQILSLKKILQIYDNL